MILKNISNLWTARQKAEKNQFRKSVKSPALANSEKSSKTIPLSDQYTVQYKALYNRTHIYKVTGELHRGLPKIPHTKHFLQNTGNITGNLSDPFYCATQYCIHTKNSVASGKWIIQRYDWFLIGNNERETVLWNSWLTYWHRNISVLVFFF